MTPEQLAEHRVRFEKVFPNVKFFEFDTKVFWYKALIGNTGISAYNDKWQGWLAAKQDSEQQRKELQERINHNPQY